MAEVEEAAVEEDAVAEGAMLVLERASRSRSRAANSMTFKLLHHLAPQFYFPRR
jgi:hypothetical protein